MNVATRDGCELVPCYNAFNYIFPKLTFIKGRKKKTGWYLNEPIAYDIETSSYPGIKNADGDWIEEPFGLMYHWQICFHGDIIIGRTWEEFELFINRMIESYNLSDSRKVIMYAHNLGFEWQNSQCFLNGEKQVFATKRRTPLTVRCYSGIELRCSYKLSNMALEKFVENTKDYYYIKAAGDLDYNIFRTPGTILSAKEEMYCASDVKSLYHAIIAKMAEESDDLESIPLTSTGYVRRHVRGYCDQSKTYRSLFSRLRLHAETYEAAINAAAGGDTHANRYLSNRIWEYCDSYDVKSSYPYVMLTKKYPMTAFTFYGSIKSKEEFCECIDNYACLFTVCFTNLECKYDNIDPYLSSSKCKLYDKDSERKCSYDNGRILYASKCITTLTDIDFKEIERGYTWDSIQISKMYVAKYGYLPIEIRTAVLDLFKEKCELEYERSKYKEGTKEYEDYDYLYQKCKNRLNGIFGMLFTNPVHSEIWEDFNDLSWHEKKLDIKDYENINKELAKFYNNRNSFIYYPWGVWTTSHARAHLHRLQRAGSGQIIYWDTDSIKGFHLNHEAIERENGLIRKEVEEREACVELHGERYYVGVYEKEKPMNRFITMGAKKYAYETKDGELKITISGVKKKLGAKELGVLENFKKDFVFHDAAALKMYYNDYGTRKQYINGKYYTMGASCSLLPNTYTLGMTDDYEKLCELYAE